MSPTAVRNPADGGDPGLAELKRLCGGQRGVAIAGVPRQSPATRGLAAPRRGGPRDPVGLEEVPLFAPPGRSSTGRCQQTPLLGERKLLCPKEQSQFAKQELPLCPVCHLPTADDEQVPSGDDVVTVHRACKAQLLLAAAKKEEETRGKRERAAKKAQREKYGIGWKLAELPRCTAPRGPAAGCRALRGKCGIAVPVGSTSVELVPTMDPAQAVDLEYLALAIQVRRCEGREPVFSLDPDYKAWTQSKTHDSLLQRKRFEPLWLSGTSLGEVLFQADYHLKELSMGEYAQPVAGMKSCFDMFKEDGSHDGHAGWIAREWFVVRGARIGLSDEGVLVPAVDMGVEARELVEGPDGVQDARLSNPDHPLVRYAKAFTHNFDLIAERKSVVHELREVAKACLVAKYLVDSGVFLEDYWLVWADEACARSTPGCEEIPQLWNERQYQQIFCLDGQKTDTNDGAIGNRQIFGVYGGVEMSLDRIELANLMVQAKKSLVVSATIPTEARTTQGVDLNLDAFTVGAPQGVEGKSAGSWMGDRFLGSSFWSAIEGADEDTLAAADRELLRDVFHPNLSDRREEGEHFLPPTTAPELVRRLRTLVAEEESVRQRRLEHFKSDTFCVSLPGPLFPLSWAPTVEVSCAKVQPKTEVPRGEYLRARPDYLADAARLFKSGLPTFDKRTEDGSRFRIYQVGSLEVRTAEFIGCAEAACAVFSISANCAAPGVN